MRLHESRRVRRPLAEVFEYTADFSNVAGWDPGVVRSAKMGDGPVGVGTRFKLDVKFWRSTIPMTYEVTAFEPPHRVVLSGKGASVEAVDEIRFWSENGETVIDYSADLVFRNALRHVEPLLRPVMRRMGKRALNGLVTTLDG